MRAGLQARRPLVVATAFALTLLFGTGGASALFWQPTGLGAGGAAYAAALAGSPPVAVDDSYTTTANTPLKVAAPGVLANDSDPDGDPLTVRPVSAPTGGSLTLSPAGSFVFDPKGLTGTFTFTYQAWDGSLASNTATVTINVTAPAAPPPTTAPAVDGAALYASSCAACHGVGGTGGFAPPLVGLSNQLIVDVTTNGKGAMPAFSTSLSAAEIQVIADYLAGLGGAPPTTPPPGTTTTTTPPPPTFTTGDQVYATFCAACHGIDLRGTALGPDIAGESRSEVFKVVRFGDDSMPAFGVSVLSDDALSMLADYVASFQSPDDDEKKEDDGEKKDDEKKKGDDGDWKMKKDDD